MPRNSLIIFVLLILLALGVGILMRNRNVSVSEPYANTGSSTDSLDTSPLTGTSTGNDSDSAVPNPCGGCVYERDNGRTYIVRETSRLTIQLPQSKYASSSLTITPAGSMGETFGASSDPGNWVRTFETLHTGTSTLRVKGVNNLTPDFLITVITTPAD